MRFYTDRALGRSDSRLESISRLKKGPVLPGFVRRIFIAARTGRRIDQICEENRKGNDNEQVSGDIDSRERDVKSGIVQSTLTVRRPWNAMCPSERSHDPEITALGSPVSA
jgi:hypothetical protein